MKTNKITYFLLSLLLVAALVGCGNNRDRRQDSHVHEYSEEWSNDEEYHWHDATCEHTDNRSKYELHVFNDGIVKKEATCSEDGIFEYTCIECGFKKQEVISKTNIHEYSSEYTYDELNHWYAATCEHSDEKSGYGLHTLDAGKVKEKATCSKDGLMEYTCTECGYKKFEVINKTNIHDFSTEYTYDDLNHWKNATCCSATSEFAPHNFKDEVTKPDCLNGGYTTHTCETCGYSYKSDFTNPLGHTYADAYSYDEANHWVVSTCEHTGLVSGVKDHYMVLVETVVATCEHGGYERYECACGYSYKTNETPATAHNVTSWAETSRTVKDATCCLYTVTYNGTCSECSATVEKTESVTAHNLHTVIIKEATCVSDGVKHVLCSCEECINHTEPLEIINFALPAGTDGHNWSEISNNNGVVEYACTNDSCTASRLVYESNEDNITSTGSQLADIGEVAVKTDGNEIRIVMDDGVKSTIGEAKEEVNVKASTLSETELEDAKHGLSSEDLAKLGNSPVYNFTIQTGSQTISELGGTATVRIAYELGDNDPNNIIVWYVSNGELTPIKATYSNGFVSFETTHFSYYTAAPITPEQYCELYGCHGTLHVVEPTCLAGGYTVCLRCNKVVETTNPLGHLFTSEITNEPGCSNNGVITYTCIYCGDTYTQTIPAKGHSFSVVDSLDPTCESQGFIKYACSECSFELKEELAATGHMYIGKEIVNPTCTSAGYTVLICASCGQESKADIISALGHSFSEELVGSKAGHYHVCSACGQKDTILAHTPGEAATEDTPCVCLDCGFVIQNPLGHTHKLEFVEKVEPTCLLTGMEEYYRCSGCGKYFYEEEAIKEISSLDSLKIAALGHHLYTVEGKPATCTEEGYTKSQVCDRCGEVIGLACIPVLGHSYNEVITKPTCTTGGYTTHTCTRCGDFYIDSEVSPLGHDYKEIITTPTCEDGGYTTHRCILCGNEYVDSEIPALGHKYGDWYPTEEGHYQLCKACGKSSEIVPHTPDYPEATEEHGIICTTCGFEIAKPKEHVHSECLTKVEAVSSTCTKRGNIEYYICSCGIWFTDAKATEELLNRNEIYLPLAEHTPDYPEATEEHGITCVVCGHVIAEKIENYIYTASVEMQGMLISFKCFEGGTCEAIAMGQPAPATWVLEDGIVTINVMGEMEFQFKVQEGSKELLSYDPTEGKEPIYVGDADMGGEVLTVNFYEDFSCSIEFFGQKLPGEWYYGLDSSVIGAYVQGELFVFTIDENKELTYIENLFDDVYLLYVKIYEDGVLTETLPVEKIIKGGKQRAIIEIDATDKSVSAELCYTIDNEHIYKRSNLDTVENGVYCYTMEFYETGGIGYSHYKKNTYRSYFGELELIDDSHFQQDEYSGSYSGTYTCVNGVYAFEFQQGTAFMVIDESSVYPMLIGYVPEAKVLYSYNWDSMVVRAYEGGFVTRFRKDGVAEFTATYTIEYSQDYGTEIIKCPFELNSSRILSDWTVGDIQVTVHITSIYIGSNIIVGSNPSDIKVEVWYSDDSSKRMTLADVSYSGLNLDVVGNYTIEITYEGFVGHYRVSVLTPDTIIDCYISNSSVVWFIENGEVKPDLSNCIVSARTLDEQYFRYQVELSDLSQTDLEKILKGKSGESNKLQIVKEYYGKYFELVVFLLDLNDSETVSNLGIEDFYISSNTVFYNLEKQSLVFDGIPCSISFHFDDKYYHFTYYAQVSDLIITNSEVNMFNTPGSYRYKIRVFGIECRDLVSVRSLEDFSNVTTMAYLVDINTVGQFIDLREIELGADLDKTFEEYVEYLNSSASYVLEVGFFLEGEIIYSNEIFDFTIDMFDYSKVNSSVGGTYTYTIKIASPFGGVLEIPFNVEVK